MSTIDFYNASLNNAATQASNLAGANAILYQVYDKLLALDKADTFNNLSQTFLQDLGNMNVPEPPAFTAQYHSPGSAPVAPNIKNIFDTAYLNADPMTVAAITAAMDSYLSAYAPSFKSALSSLQDSVLTGMTTGKAIEDAVETAMYNMAAQRIESEGYGQQLQAKNLLKKRGYELPQVYFNAIANRMAIELADRLAQSATEITVERAKLELQHKQFCMQISTQIQNFIMNSMLQFAQIVASLKEFALRYATAAAEAATKTYQAEVDVFKAKIEAAVEELKGAVDVNKALLDAYIAKIEAQLKEREQHYEVQKMKLEASITVFEADVKKKLTELEVQVQALSAAVGAAKAAADGLAAVAQAAMAGVNAIASEHTEL
jgi:hypothetical protein